MKIKPQYSDKRSEKIWEKINTLPDKEGKALYGCFCLLQNMEQTCLVWLNNAIKEEKDEERD